MTPIVFVVALVGKDSSKLTDTGALRALDGVIYNISYVSNAYRMLRCLHLTDPVIKGHRSRIIDTIILIICI